MSKGLEIRQALMTSAIRVVAAQGIQNATTKALATESKLNEVYIYRAFKSKDDLLEQTFYALDKELMFLLNQLLKRIDKTQNVRDAFRSLFDDFWIFTLGDIDKCSFFIQYYYSAYYMTYSDTARKTLYQPFLDSIDPAFTEGVDSWEELNHMYDIVFPKLWRIIRGTLPNTKETKEKVYRELIVNVDEKMLWNNKVEL